MARLSEANLRLNPHKLDDEQLKALALLEKQWGEHANHSTADPLEQSDREQEIADWLGEQGVQEGWSIAASLAEAGLSPSELRQRIHPFPSAALGDILVRISYTLLVGRLVDEIDHSTTRISDLVKAIKEYPYMDRAGMQEVDLHHGLESTLLILKYRWKSGIEIVREYDRTLPRICERPGELNQVRTNLIVNAIDAMNDKGELRLRTAREFNCALVEVIDNGSGIPSRAAFSILSSRPKKLVKVRA